MTYYANKRVAKANTLFTTPYWKHVTKRVQTKIFAFSRHVPSYNRVSVTTNIKNSGLLVRIQDDDEENSAARWKLRAVLRLRWTALKTKWWKKMRIKIRAETCQFFSHHVKEKRLKIPAMREHFGIFGCGLKYKSVPILFFFVIIEEKPEICNSWFFWACDTNRKSQLRCDNNRHLG